MEVVEYSKIRMLARQTLLAATTLQRYNCVYKISCVGILAGQVFVESINLVT
jgi:hypothetical protein